MKRSASRTGSASGATAARPGSATGWASERSRTATFFCSRSRRWKTPSMRPSTVKLPSAFGRRKTRACSPSRSAGAPQILSPTPSARIPPGMRMTIRLPGRLPLITRSTRATESVAIPPPAGAASLDSTLTRAIAGTRSARSRSDIGT